MTRSSDQIGNQFYKAFAEKDIAGIESLYHKNLQFHDPAFGSLNQAQTLAMWKMLFGASDDLRVTFNVLSTAESKVIVEWVAQYSFGKKRRKVINRVVAELILEDNLIIEHSDHFNLHRWATQALGLPGLFMGWTIFFKRQLQNQTRARLHKFMHQQD